MRFRSDFEPLAALPPVADSVEDLTPGPPAATVGGLVPGRFPSYALVDHRHGQPDVESDDVRGGLPLTILRGVVNVLSTVTAPEAECIVFVWEGHGWIPKGWRAMPMVRRPARRYLCASCPLSEIPILAVGLPQLKAVREHAYAAAVLAQELDVVASDGDLGTVDYGWSPEIWLPPTAEWCVASDVDSAVSVIAGSADLIERIVADDSIGATQIDPGETLR